jgi:hypothetical protein
MEKKLDIQDYFKSYFSGNDQVNLLVAGGILKFSLNKASAVVEFATELPLSRLN